MYRWLESVFSNVCVPAYSCLILKLELLLFKWPLSSYLKSQFIELSTGIYTNSLLVEIGAEPGHAKSANDVDTSK